MIQVEKNLEGPAGKLAVFNTALARRDARLKGTQGAPRRSKALTSFTFAFFCLLTANRSVAPAYLGRHVVSMFFSGQSRKTR